MIRAYKYLFYKLFLLERMLFDPVPGLTAFGLMLVLQCLNVFSLFLIIDRLISVSLPFRWSAPNLLCGVALLALPQYFFLLHRGRFRRVVGEFTHETERQSVVGGFIVGVYILSSFLLPFFAVSIPPRHV
jgi:hypothetical protein